MTTTFRNFLAFLTAAVLLSAGPGLLAADLIEVRFGPGADKTRIVFDLDGNTEFAISGDASGEGRIFIDFSGLEVAASDREFKPGKGHVARLGFANASGGGTRAVIELKKTAKIKEAFMIPPTGNMTKHRFVVDLQTSDKTAFLESLPTKYADLATVIEQATSEAEAAKQAPPPPPEKVTIVIDPGHGGFDPGSQGQSGTVEKNVTLAAALELKDILEKRGHYEVVLTREADKDSKMKSDQRSELARREKLAREADAELFISLHADAIAQKGVRGASVYTLSDQGTTRSANMAKSQGDYVVYNLDVKEFGDGVDDILFDLAQSATSTNSAKFANLLIANLNGKTQLLNRSHRTGDLRVLLAPDVPAVLLEMAFISNAHDEANLNSPVWRNRAMTAVADAIDQYFDLDGVSRHASAGANGAQ